MSEPVIWLELVKTAATVGATIVAAVWASRLGTSQRDIAKQQALTAFEQKRISAAKLNLDLFKERYDLFMKVWGFLSDALEDTADKHSHPLQPEFTNLIPKARFLFGDEIANYMGEANKKRVQLWTLLHMQRRGEGNPTFEGKNIGDMHTWFSDEATNCFRRFADYLDFSAWKIDPLERLVTYPT